MISLRNKKAFKEHRSPMRILDDDDKVVGMTPDVWLVRYDYNSVIAECDTEQEADQVLAAINNFINMFP